MTAEWMDQAACANGSGCLPEWWDRSSDAGYSAGNKMALAICKQCPVTVECFDAAVSEGLRNEGGMIRGGMVFPAGRKGEPHDSPTGRRPNRPKGVAA